MRAGSWSAHFIFQKFLRYWSTHVGGGAAGYGREGRKEAAGLELFVGELEVGG